MTWTAYQVTFRLLSPLHVGWRKLGNLQQTRPYVTGRSLWGALTARLTREAGGNNYIDIGKEVDKQLAFTYFYPSTRPDDIPVRLWPWPEEWDKFAWTFLGSYASTALENARNAEAGSLHETEFIAPYARKATPDGEPIPVYLVGYIFEKDNYTIKRSWRDRDILNNLQLGGERGYGWGRVHLRGDCKSVSNGKCFDYDLLLDGDRPRLKAPGELRLLAHTRTDTDSAGNRGVAIEPLVGRETQEATGFGKNHSRAQVCWVPGGKVTENETFQIQPKGIWEIS
jgi:hypothetical protein